jgi:hypothetical protein
MMDDGELPTERPVPTVENVGRCLRDITPTMQNPEEWSWVKGLRSFGEIRDSLAFRQLPLDQEVRVVLIRDADGLVLRWWCDPELGEEASRVANSIPPGTNPETRREILSRVHSRIITHEHLATYEPTSLGEVRSGYVHVMEDNKGGLDVSVFASGKEAKFYLPSRGVVGV